jgi:hypothetical protein
MLYDGAIEEWQRLEMPLIQPVKDHRTASK